MTAPESRSQLSEGPSAIEQAIAMLEVCADYGMEATDADGRPTANARYCREAIARLKALPSETAFSSEPTAWAVYAADTHELLGVELIEPEEGDPTTYVEALHANRQGEAK
jgi:hypothetical protein